MRFPLGCAGAVRVRAARSAGHGKERGWAAGKPARKRPLILCKHSHKSDSWALCFDVLGLRGSMVFAVQVELRAELRRAGTRILEHSERGHGRDYHQVYIFRNEG